MFLLNLSRKRPFYVVSGRPFTSSWTGYFHFDLLIRKIQVDQNSIRLNAKERQTKYISYWSIHKEPMIQEFLSSLGIFMDTGDLNRSCQILKRNPCRFELPGRLKRNWHGELKHGSSSKTTFMLYYLIDFGNCWNSFIDRVLMR